MVDLLKIRRAIKEDVNTIHFFLNQLESINSNIELFTEIYLQNISQTHAIYLVAEFDLKVIGFISCHEQLLLHHLGYVFEIQEFFVLDTYRNKGIGAILLAELENILKQKKIVSFEVTAQNKRLQTHQFYLKNGFTQSHLKFTKLV